MNKNEAILNILRVLRSQAAAVNKANREEALTLAEEHGITVRDLIEVWEKMALRV